MRTRTSRTLLAAFLSFVMIGAAPPAAAHHAYDCSSIIQVETQGGATLVEELCEEANEAIDRITGGGGGLVILYQEVRPDGKWGNLDCVYDSAANTSVVIEWWQIWVEAGTMDSSGNRDPIVGTYVYYLWVDTQAGNVC